MGNLPNRPIAWANHITKILEVVYGDDLSQRFPVRVAEVAKEISKNLFPEDSINQIEGADLSDRFEGLLTPIPGEKTGWGIIYNSSIRSKGRQNFTLAHEFGHYLVHRKQYPEGIKCSRKDMMDWSSKQGQVEQEANTFASYLLMPRNDFEEQIKEKKVTLSLLNTLAERYEVSLTAAVLRWISFTDKRAMIVVGKDGFIDWAWSSQPLLGSGIFYRPRQQIIELPKSSLAARRDPNFSNLEGVSHAKGVWLGNETVEEMTVISEEYDNLSISLLVYPSLPKVGGYFHSNDDGPDSYDWITRNQLK